MPFSSAHAACSSPAGDAGDQFYNTTHNVMQFCNGDNWVNMGAIGGITSESDPQVGTLTNGKWCTTDGTDIDCTSDAPSGSTAWGDLVGVPAGFADGTDDGITSESDPKVGAVTNNKWCRSDGTQVICDQDAPSGGGGLVLLDSGTVTNQATLNIVLTSYTSYRALYLLLTGFRPATDGAVLYTRLSTNGGSTYDAGASDYNWLFLVAGADFIGDAEADAVEFDNTIELTRPIGNVASEGVEAEITLYNQAATTFRSRLKFQTTYYNSADNVVHHATGSGMRNTAQDTDAMRIMFSSGNIAAGKWALYGYQ